VGYVFYVDRFAQDLKGVLKHLDYLEEMGATYVHFMPCLKPRPAPNDGGYSVMDYRAIDPRLGTMKRTLRLLPPPCASAA
jgi:amylosucrase